MISKKRTRPIKPQIKNRDNSIDASPLSKGEAIRNCLFFLAWLYLIVRVFFTDIDLLIAREMGLNNTILYLILRVLVISSLIIILWLKIGNLKFWKNIGFFFLFPIYPALWLVAKKMLWSIPIYLYKADFQLLLYFYLDSIIDFFVDFKHIFLRNTLLVLAFVGVFTFNEYWVIIPILFFGMLLIMHLIQRLKQTFSPIKLFRLNLDSIENASKDSFSPEKIEQNFAENAPQKISRQERLTKQVEHFLILNESLKALKIKLKYIQNNRIYMLSFINRTVMSIVFCAIYFSGINYGLYKFNPDNFDTTTKLYFIDFFEYSFYSIFPEGIGISPISDIARILRMLGTFTGVLLNVFLFIIYMTVSNERQKENLDRMLNYTTERSQRFETHFKEKYGKSPSEGIDWIKSRGSEIETFLGHIRRGINSKK